MTYIFLAIVGATLALLAGFHRWSNKPVRRSPDEICALLESWLENTIDWSEWDYFESCVIEDPDLEVVRQECLAIDHPNSGYIDNTSNTMSHLNEAGRNRVRDLLKKCKQLCEPNERT